MNILALVIAALMLLPIRVFSQYKNESEASIVVTGGNSQLETYSSKTSNKYTQEANLYTINGSYVYGESSDVRSNEAWDVLARYDRTLSEHFTLFIAELVESNRFAGFRRRYNSDLGAKYTFLKTEKNTSFIELGYRYSVEKKSNRNLEDDKDHKARIYVESAQKLSESANAKLWVEYLPNFTESKDYLISTEASMSMALDKTFSIKLAYKWTMDNLPAPGTSKYDYIYTTSLLANF